MYHIQEPIIRWIPEDRQMKIINAIPEEHRPIFLWLKLHLRRPAEAMALRKEDYDKETNCFTIRRSVSDRKHIDRTKTSAVHIIPCSKDFELYLGRCLKVFGSLFFTNPSARNTQRCYSREILARLWRVAAKSMGEDIGLYQG
jgi:integrase